MHWATESKPVPLSELGWISCTYLSSTTPACDPMLVWGTTVDTELLQEFLSAQRQQANLMLTPAHVLIAAVAAELRKHPEFNRRIIGRRVYQYNSVSVVMPMLHTRSGEVDCVNLRDVDEMSLKEIAATLWSEARNKATAIAANKTQRSAPFSMLRWMQGFWKKVELAWIHRMSGVGFYVANRLRTPTIWPWQQELNGAGAFVNYLGFSGAPPLIAHKPAALPMNSYSILVTLGASEPTPVVDQDKVVIRQRANLFVRFDHRMVNGNQSGMFIDTLRNLISNPDQLISDHSQNLRAA